MRKKYVYFYILQLDDYNDSGDGESDDEGEHTDVTGDQDMNRGDAESDTTDNDDDQGEGMGQKEMTNDKGKSTQKGSVMHDDLGDFDPTRETSRSSRPKTPKRGQSATDTAETDLLVVMKHILEDANNTSGTMMWRCL